MAVLPDRAAPADRAPRIKPWRRYLTVGVLLFLLAVLLSTPLMSWWLSARGPVPQETYLQELPEVNGSYLLTSQGVLPLFTWYMPLPKMPDDAPTLDSGQVQSFVVIQALHFEPEQYTLMELNSSQVLSWTGAEQDGKHLTLYPESLSPGDYLFIQPTTSMYGEDHFFYFRIR